MQFELTEDNFIMFAVKNYDNPGCHGMDEFYDDLRYHNSNQKYFFGTLLLKDAGNEKPFNLIEVVDGQQRTTTIIIFINVLLYLLKQKGSKIELEIFKSRRPAS